MNGHYEIVHTDARQPWFARHKFGNELEGWKTSENYTRERGALAAIVDHVLIILRTIDPDVHCRLTPDGLVVWRSDQAEDTAQLIPIYDVDERTETRGD